MRTNPTTLSNFNPVSVTVLLVLAAVSIGLYVMKIIGEPALALALILSYLECISVLFI